MKNLVLFMAGIFLVTTLIGCSKKKEQQESSLDNMTNGVASENVVSVADATAGSVKGGSVPVVVDNAEAVPQAVGDMAAGAAVSGDKPTPRQIQQALKAAGFYKGKVDGNVGPKTKKAIEEFQSANGLKADGKVGPRTWKALSAHLSDAVEVANPTTQAQAVGQ